MSLKIVSINIEGQKHLKSVERLLAKENPDVACLMEVCQDDVLQIAGDEYPFVVFAPNDVLGNIAGSQELEPTGVVILSKTVMIDVEKTYLGEKPRRELVPPKSGTHAPVLLMAKIGEYQIGVIHFTWSKKGIPSDQQRQHLAKLIDYLGEKEEFVLVGDFNIPRSNELYKKLAAVWYDNIPPEVETTLDSVMHYANEKQTGKLKLVVDYAWSTPKYDVTNVRVVANVSDHCAVMCKVSKVT